MSTLSGLISAGGGGSLFNIWIYDSQTWTPPFNGTGVIHVIGAGGGGHLAHRTNQQNYDGGGTGGGYVRKAVTFSTSTNWTLVIGAGGASVYKAYSDSAGVLEGNNGGNSTATDGSSSLTAGGGKKGSTSTQTGGSASGGDVNYTGGLAGDNASFQLGGGGGAVGTQASGGGPHGAVGGPDRGQDSDAMAPYDPNAYGIMTGGGRGGKAMIQYYYSASDQRMHGGNGGFLAGGGTAYIYNGESSSLLAVIGGDGGHGGGGGSAVDGHSGQQKSTRSGKGGDGIIYIQYLTVT
jgi:hypothetical protein